MFIPFGGQRQKLTIVAPFGVGGLNYTVPDAMGTGRWLEPYAPPPWNKEVVKRASLTFFDGVLTCLRNAQRAKGYIAVGEGAIILMGALDETIRAAAYKERHVNETEQVAFEGIVFMRMQQHVAIYLHCYPHNQYMPFLRHYLAEFCHLDIGSVQLTIVVPENDPLTKPVRDLARLVTGAVSVEVSAPSPAY